MSQLPFEQSEGLRIGTVDFVSPDEIKVSLDVDAPDSVALNAGTPRLFPRVNGYILIPVDSELLVGQIEWITIERSSFPKRKGMQDFGLIDLPYPMRRMSVNPLGVLRKSDVESNRYSFQRGSAALPSIGTSVLIPTDIQLRDIVESGANRRVSIGTSPMAADANVAVDPDRLFGRHLAVLGNTGSGKSCSVAGLIHWSLKAAATNGTLPNARFIVLDPNGEYAHAFAQDGQGHGYKVFRVDPNQDHNFEKLLRVPLWFWNSAEWASFTQATAKTQRPILIQALRWVREGKAVAELDEQEEVRRYLRIISSCVRSEERSGRAFKPFPHSKNLHSTLEKAIESLNAFSGASGTTLVELKHLIEMLEGLAVPRRKQYADMQYSTEEVRLLIEAFDKAIVAYGGTNVESTSLSADTPHAFTSSDLISTVEATAHLLRVTEHCETLVMRIRGIMADERMKPLVGENEGETLGGWLSEYISNQDDNRSPISILDLSLVPAEVSHLLAAVVARIIFESLQRYRKVHGVTLPTVLVMEEAHTFIKQYKEDLENANAAAVCCQAFEKIAREGRKFGLGLVLSSQRPSELSSTVLSQCNSFLLHRISNDRDQEIVNKLVPDNLRGLLRELPSLPPRDAILLGWASELPIMVRMHELEEAKRPHSADPDFWAVWTGRDSDGHSVDRPTGWDGVVADWLGEG